MREIRVGLIGLGFIGKVHTICYRNLALCYPQPGVSVRLVVLLRSQPGADPAPGRMAGFEQVTGDPQAFFSTPLDLVDVCSPNDLHPSQVEQALSRGLAVYCEKPLAASLPAAHHMAEAASQAGVLNQVAFINRYLPAVRQMRTLIASGAIGEVYTFRAQKLHASYLDPGRPMSWRLRREASGGGVWMDLGIHLVDLVHYLLGGVASARAEMRTMIAQRPAAKGSPDMEPVDVDDWAQVTLRLSSGAVGTLEVSRVAAGAEETSGFEVYGSRGALAFRDSSPRQASFYDLKKKQWVQGGLEVQPAPGERPLAQVWPESKLSQGEMTDKHMAAIYDLLLNLAEGKPAAVDFAAGLQAQAVVEAAYRSARRNGDWVSVEI